ncbi:hypothetical protein CALCODRAFT_494450 [Calocera cornea HHB12733]|uniref:Uncharacterized protein n=1 Tax=Calocera cornea HHB12733 TaxID=1353952 RepID=A0A165H1D6_9BASI|nr:hypothetical protein CALCODRAFT_494450 [Calocera cornea HHB12733]
MCKQVAVHTERPPEPSDAVTPGLPGASAGSCATNAQGIWHFLMLRSQDVLCFCSTPSTLALTLSTYLLATS